jgi:hypothetical protein
MASSWYEAFRRDMRGSIVVRAVEAGLGHVSSATAAASSWTSQRFLFASHNLRQALGTEVSAMIRRKTCSVRQHGY